MSYIHDLHLGNIDWTNKIHQRIVAANLVQGAYNMESDRHGNSNNPGDEKAEAIGERLGFEISDRLIDTDDGSYFGTIYKFKYANLDHDYYNSEIIPPKYAIAFRGTSLDPENIGKDVLYDVEFIFHELHKSARYAIALQAVQDIISISGGPENVWLAGHSLGSLIALLVSRSMVIENGFHLKTYLFNPPFVAYSNLKPLRHIYWYGRSIITAGTEMIVHHLTSSREKIDEIFNKLNAWSPYLFVNKRDYISNGYISYFKQREKMNMIGAGGIENLATQNSMMSLIGELVGENFEPIHLIPSANLTISEGSIFHPLIAHGIKQWWQNMDLSIHNESYIFNNSLFGANFSEIQ
ncbi:hydrolase [Lithospermum erythrorhizon]|uniref:Hydrolase n=1 Tax=Lithospermum erythrorhizon TaxID=34254 RepID=A0AAV3RAT4_LITER